MAEDKKPGLFSRLFGGAQVAPKPEAPPESPPAPAPPAPEQPEPADREDETAVADKPVDETAELAPDTDVLPEAEPEPTPAPAEPPAKAGWFQRLTQGLSRSSNSIGAGIVSIFTKRKLDDETLEELENVLIQADLGVATATAITTRLAEGRFGKDISEEEVRSVLAGEVEAVLAPVAQPFEPKPLRKPHVVLVVGVNGSGKTTTIGKLAAKFRAEGLSVMLAAGDTFRAAAIDQLKVWGERTGAPVVARQVGADSAGLAFDALTQARLESRDILMIDTAGRLQNKTELMAELEKVIRVIRKVDPTAPHDVLLVLDATTGQNALGQVEVFQRTAGVTGLVMTKLDGTARGGILVAIARQFKLPVHFIGIGEAVDDLEPFAARDFARAIAGIAD
ncbi:MAG TPA: signal recognition particle-docking protein FtsY [Methylomirabilota bacterium]|nr:signal recognition particle-docking protein FtsY [Methylomirabilota bacterium]